MSLLKFVTATVACLMLLGVSATKAEDERYVVEIKVDVSDVDASRAREKAMSNAARAATTAVAKRVTTAKGAERIAAMTDAQLINFVKETSVLDEKISNTRYAADLKVVINEDLLKEYMRERDIPLEGTAVTPKKTVLIVPLFREFSDDTPMLWEVDNLWKKAWDNAQSSAKVNFVTIPASAGNQAVLSAGQAAATDASALEKVMKLNGADDVYVLDASYNGIEGLDIMATSLSGNRMIIKVVGAKSSGELLFNQAVENSRRQLEQQILSDTPENAIDESEMTVLYPFPTLGDWITAERKIKELSAVSELQVQAMAPHKAQFKILYHGSVDTLKRLITAQGYTLNDGGNYVILGNKGED
jgi:hypothetical protein